MPSSSNRQPKQSALLKDALQQPQPSSSPPIDVTDEARVVYSRLRTLGLPSSVTFEGFLSVYTLGLGSDNLQTDVYSKERNLDHGKSIVRSKARVRLETSGGGNRKGKWKETLDMVAQRLVGRSEAARVRASILAATSNGEAPLEDPMKIADDKRKSLYRVLGSVQKEWEIENRQLMDLDRRKKELESEIEHKMKVILLLYVLEKREGLRMKRIGTVGNRAEESGIGDLIKKSRTAATTLNPYVFQDMHYSVQKHPALNTILAPSSLERLQLRPNLRYKHSMNALANLHSYHFRLVNIKSSMSTAPNGSKEDVNKRIENALKTLGIKDIQNTKQRLVELARLRAERRRKFNIRSVTDSSVSEACLEELQRMNERKKQEVQHHLNRAIALGWICEGYVDLMATFREETVPALIDSMVGEQKRVEGYVDKIKVAILGQRRKTSGSFSQRVREIMGVDKVKVWEELDEDLKYSSPKVDVMVLGQAEKGLVVDEMDFPGISRLLERKSQKAETGFAMAEEIQGLLQGCKKLKYI